MPVSLIYIYESLQPSVSVQCSMHIVGHLVYCYVVVVVLISFRKHVLRARQRAMQTALGTVLAMLVLEIRHRVEALVRPVEREMHALLVSQVHQLTYAQVEFFRRSH